MNDIHPRHEWREPTFDQPCTRLIQIDGNVFRVPETARLKVVRGTGMLFVHVNVGRLVHVLSAAGELSQSREDMARAALAAHWTHLDGDPVH